MSKPGLLFLAVFAATVILTLVLIQVLPRPVDRGECLARESYNTTQVVMVGKTLIVQPVVRSRCTQWEFPEGRPE